MADRGLALLDAEHAADRDRGARRAARGGLQRRGHRCACGSCRCRAARSARCTSTGKPVALDRPRGQEAAWLHELGLEARAALVEPLSMEGQGGGLVIALRSDGGFRGPDRQALSAFAASVAQRLAAERSVEIERLRYGMEARERERTRWAREIHDESIQGIGALRLQLANARDLDDAQALSSGRGRRARGPRHRDRRAAPPDHRASPRGARRPRARRRAARRSPGARRRSTGWRSRPRSTLAQAGDGQDASARTAAGAWTPSSRARSTASCRRRSRTSAATRRPRGGRQRHRASDGVVQRVGHRRRRGTARRRAARPARRRTGGRLRHVGHARARRARRRRAELAAGARARDDRAPDRAARRSPAQPTPARGRPPHAAASSAGG